MKFNLTITDIEATEIDKLLNAVNIINTPKTVTAVKAPAVEEAVEVEVPEGDFEQPAPFEPAFDKNGLPWDARIHSSNHKLTDKGIWQRRRGVTDIEFERVKNELLGLAAQPTTPTVTIASTPAAPQVIAPAPLTPQVVAGPTAPTPVASVAPTPMYTNPAVMNQPVFAPTVAPAVPAQPTVTVAPTAPTAPDINVLFQTMFDKIKAGMASGVVGPNYVQTLIATVNGQFGTQYQTIAAVRDNADVMQYIINDLVTKGL